MLYDNNGMNKPTLVAYYDLFNPSEIIQAPSRNNIKSFVIAAHVKQYYKKLSDMDAEEKESYLLERAAVTECHCHHATFETDSESEVCHYRNCRHDKAHHN